MASTSFTPASTPPAPPSHLIILTAHTPIETTIPSIHLSLRASFLRFLHMLHSIPAPQRLASPTLLLLAADHLHQQFIPHLIVVSHPDAIRHSPHPAPAISRLRAALRRSMHLSIAQNACAPYARALMTQLIRWACVKQTARKHNVCVYVFACGPIIDQLLLLQSDFSEWDHVTLRFVPACKGQQLIMTTLDEIVANLLETHVLLCMPSDVGDVAQNICLKTRPRVITTGEPPHVLTATQCVRLCSVREDAMAGVPRLLWAKSHDHGIFDAICNCLYARALALLCVARGESTVTVVLVIPAECRGRQIALVREVAHAHSLLPLPTALGHIENVGEHVDLRLLPVCNWQPHSVRVDGVLASRRPAEGAQYANQRRVNFDDEMQLRKGC